MDPSTWAGTLTAAFTLVTAVVVFFGARATIRATRKVETHVDQVHTDVDAVKADVDKVGTGVQAIHSAVNSRLDAMLARQELMISAMEKAGLTVPPPVPLPEMGGSSHHG